MNWTERVVPFHLHPLGFIDAFTQNGATMSALLERAGISSTLLDIPNSKISYQQFVRLLRSGIELCQRPGLGLLTGRYFDWCYYGLPGLAIQSSTNFKQAALILHRYTCLAQPYYAIYKSRPAYFVDNHQHVTIPVNYLITSELEDEKLRRFELEFRVGLILQILHQFFGDRDSSPLHVEVQLAMPRPYHMHLYQQFPNCEFHFNCPASQFILPLNILSEGEDQIRTAVCEHVLRYCGRELAEVENLMSFSQRLMAMFYENIPFFLSQSEAADLMGVTTRTLARRLQQENTTFMDVLNQVRSEIATYFLTSTQLTVPDIAESLGFSDTGNFRQAFKRWTGLSACEVRGTANAQIRSAGAAARSLVNG